MTETSLTNYYFTSTLIFLVEHFCSSAASHQGAIETLWLHFWELPCRPSLFTVYALNYKSAHRKGSKILWRVTCFIMDPCCWHFKREVLCQICYLYYIKINMIYMYLCIADLHWWDLDLILITVGWLKAWVETHTWNGPCLKIPGMCILSFLPCN